jgi:transglutaminase-like putative cysteine protease
LTGEITLPIPETSIAILLFGSISLWVTLMYRKFGGFQLGPRDITNPKVDQVLFVFVVLLGIFSLPYNFTSSVPRPTRGPSVIPVDVVLLTGASTLRLYIRSNVDRVTFGSDMKGKVDPAAVNSTAEELAGNQTSENEGEFSYRQVAELHRYVNENINYVLDPDGDPSISRSEYGHWELTDGSGDVYVSPPDETLEEGSGDCDCQAVLVASFFEAVGATTRFVHCYNEDGDGHALCEVRLADSPDSNTQEIKSALDSYYASYTGFAYETDSDGIWYPADTAMGRYVGDIGQLSDDGFVHEKDDVSWEWHDAEYYYP